MAKTPKAVKDAAKKADELHKEIYGEAGDDTVSAEPTGAPEAPEDATGEDIQPVEPAAEPAAPEDTLVAPPEGQGADITPAPQDPPQPEPAAPPAEDWEKKYQVLQGKYNAEVPRMAADIRALNDQIQALVANQSAPSEPAAAPTPTKEVVSEQDIVDYGEDLVDLIRRVARGEAENLTTNLTPQIEEIKGQVQKSAAKQEKQTVYSKLDADVQDWRNINKSPEFNEWLANVDPYAGDYRKNLLSQAFEKGDANRVTAFFQGFLAERQAVTPAQSEAPIAPAPEAPAQNGQVSLETLAGPAGGPTSGVVNTQPEQPPSWTRAQVAQFYKDVNSGVFKSDPDRKAQIEASIASALQAGRVQ